MKRHFKMIPALLLCIALLLPMAIFGAGAEGADVWDGSVATSFAGGMGTKDDPYQITSGAHLALLSQVVNHSKDYVSLGGLYFKVMNDIDMNDLPFEPIGGFDDDIFFAGHFDGNGKTISNLNLTGGQAAEFMNVGLFGCISGAVVRDLTLKNLTETDGVTAYTYFNAGALVGKAINSKVIGCHVNSPLIFACFEEYSQTTIYAGGVIGFAEDGGTIKGCTYHGILTVNGRGDNEGGNRVATVFGGIVGRLDWNEGTDDKQYFIEDCMVTGKLQNVSSTYHVFVGGLVGIGFNGWGASDNVQTQTPMVHLKNILVDADVDVSKLTMDNTPQKNSYVVWGGIVSRTGAYAVSMDNVHFVGTATGEDNPAFKNPDKTTAFSGIVGVSCANSTYTNVTTAADKMTVSAEEKNEDGSVKFEANWKGNWDRATCEVYTLDQKDAAKATVEANIAALSDYSDAYDASAFEIFNPFTTEQDSETETETETETEAKTETEAATTEPAGSAQESTAQTEPEQSPKGCKALAAGAILATAAAAAVVLKKKKD